MKKLIMPLPKPEKQTDKAIREVKDQLMILDPV